MGPLILGDGTTNSGVGPLCAPLTGWFVGRPCGNTVISHLAIFLIIVVDCANVWLSGPIVGGFVVPIRGPRCGESGLATLKSSHYAFSWGPREALTGPGSAGPRRVEWLGLLLRLAEGVRG